MVEASILKKVARKLLGRPVETDPAAGEKAASFYDEYYALEQKYHIHYTRSDYYFLWAVIADRIENGGIRSVLEIGCGPGQLAGMMMERGVPNWTGMDFSAKAVEMARLNCPRGRFEVGDARTTDLHGRIEHDLVVCTEVLEHIESDLAVVSKFKPGVRCICTVPSFPYHSHVRHFKDRDEVAARYGPLFEDLKVTTWISPRNGEDLFFLMDGRRNEHVVS